MAKFICKFLGLLFVLAGLLGFLAPGLMDLHLNATHNMIHLVTGLLALGFGSAGTVQAARKFALTFGVIYLFLGIAGLLAPPGSSGMPGMAVSDHMLRVIPGELEFGTPDSILHCGFGFLLMLSALQAPKSVAKKVRKQTVVREKVVA